MLIKIKKYWFIIAFFNILYMVGDYVKKIRDIIIVISIVVCLVVIYIAKQQTKKV